jgi:hypothetical protein
MASGFIMCGLKKNIFIFLVFLVFNVQGQNACTLNLVGNPSFEDTVACPIGQAQLNKAVGWFSPSTNTPDYFHTCHDPPQTITPVGVPANFEGFQFPKTGLAYAGFASYSPASNNGREYVSRQLQDTLVPTARYKISFYISLSDSSKFSINRIGVFFSDTVPIWPVNQVMQVQPQIEFFSDSTFADKYNWLELSAVYTATGVEQYITIGTFVNDTTLQIDTTPGTWGNAYYYIDDVSVCQCDSTVTPPPPRPPAFQLFPNPNDGVFSISGPFAVDDRIVVYDAVGRLIFSYHVTAEHNLLQLFPQLATGVYVCRVERKDEVLFKRRVVVAE